MKTFAIFYHLSTGYVEGSMPPRFDKAHVKPIEACGDRASLRIDSRLTIDNAESLARDWAKKHKFVGYKIVKGNGLQNNRTIVNYRSIV